MRFLAFLLLVLLSFFAASQNTCYIQSPPTFSAAVVVISSGDFTGDGIMDILSPVSGLEVFPGAGNGTFGAAINYSSGLNYSAAGMVQADFNNDGQTDLAIVSYTNQLSVMLRNSTGFAPPQVYTIYACGLAVEAADMDNDGDQDLVAVNNATCGISLLTNNGTGAFSVASFSIPINPTSLVLSDVNNDGNKDLAIGNVNNNILIYLNNGSAQFTSTVSVTTPSICYVLKSADFNNDGNMDLAAGRMDSLVLLNGDGASGFSVTASYGTGYGVESMALGDVNGDGILDIIATDNENVVTAHINNGSGSFSQSSWVSPHYFAGITLNDFTGDGRADIAGVAPGGSPNTSVLINNGSGGFFATGAFKVTSTFQNNANMHVSTGDMNNDGNLDILTADNNLQSFSILYGTGTGSFSTSSYSTSIIPLAATAGDFNGDGKPDVAVVGYTNSLVVYMNAGAGTYTLNASYNTGVSPSVVKSADLNNDGYLDLLVANYGSNSISVRLGLGNGSFGNSASYAVGSNANDITIADFDHDGYKDVAVAVWNDFVKVFSGSSTGALTLSASYIVFSVPAGITSGDFNGDGFDDLAVSCLFSDDFYVMLNSGSGSFSTSSPYNIGFDNLTIITGDYNLDGYLDIATGCQQSSDKMNIYNGNGTGTFAAPASYPMGENPLIITSGDFNNDGKADFASASSNYVAVLLTSNVPTISVSGPTITCADAPLTLTASGATGYYWSGTSSGSGATAIAYPTANASYTVTGVNSPACPVSVVKTVSVIPSPTVLISSVSNSLCAGDSLALVASGGLTYTWSNGPLSPSVTVTPSVTSIYTVTGTGGNGCSDTAVKMITVYSQPTITTTGPTSMCANSAATLTASGAMSYTWSTGASSSSVTVNPSTNTCYQVAGTSTAGCSNSASLCVNVVAPPSVIISPASATVCQGSSETFTASGATNYTWVPNINTTTMNVLPAASQTYTLYGDANGCLDSAYVSLSVDPQCSEVWPGDANSDGQVDASDVLEIGLAFSNTGTVRSVQGNAYAAHYATNWIGTVSTGKNKCHADCDGDSTVTFADTLAISNNFSLTHAFRTAQFTGVADIMLVSPTGNLVVPGSWNELDIWVSDTTLPAPICGTNFDISYDQSLIEPNSVSLIYTPSFLNQGNTNVEFRKANFPIGMLYGATVRTDASNANGGGKIGEFYFKVKQVADGTVLNTSIGNSKKVLANGNTAPLTGNTLTLTTNTALGLSKTSAWNSLSFYPNPATNRVTLASSFPSEVTYVVIDMFGHSILQGSFVKQKTIDVSALSPGSYILTLKSGEASVYRQLVVGN